MKKSRAVTVPILSWALYDFANTIFSATVITFYFPLYITNLTGANRYLGLASTGAMLLAGLATPWLGSLADHTGRARKHLLTVTLLCIAGMALLGFLQSPGGLLACFMASCFFFHACLVLYNTLLPAVAEPEKQGFASGLGVGLGYLGVVAALPFMHQVENRMGLPAVFPFGALLFFLFSLPLFLFVRAPRTAAADRPRISFAGEWRAVGQTLREIAENPRVFLFMAGNFFLVDAVNSTIFWFSVYARNVFDPGRRALVMVMMGLNACAFLSGLFTGWLTDRAGAMETLLAASAALVLMLLILTLPIPFAVFVVLTLAAGSFSIAGIWTAGRKVLLEMAPPGRTGSYFGVYGLTTKVSVVGSLVYGLSSDVWGMRQGLWALVIPAVLGLVLLGASTQAPRGSSHD